MEDRSEDKQMHMSLHIYTGNKFVIVELPLWNWRGEGKGKGNGRTPTILKHRTSVQVEDVRICTESCGKWGMEGRDKGE